MNLSIILVVLLFLAALVVIRLWLNKLEEKSKISDDLVEWLKNSNLQFATLQRTIGEFSEIGRSMKELQEYLTSPKLRGNIGEQVLKELLAQNFPKSAYKLQYRFKTGSIVDAALITSQGLIPIDSKFPIEAFKKISQSKDANEVTASRKEFERDVKHHIDDISKKYVLPEEKTLDYALMYIPSESVYYELINNEAIFNYAGKNRVLPVSPMSFYAYLKAILISFEGQKIETKAKEILNILQAMKKDYEKMDEALSILNRHIVNAYNQSSQVTKNFQSLGQKLTSTNLLSLPDKE